MADPGLPWLPTLLVNQGRDLALQMAIPTPVSPTRRPPATIPPAAPEAGGDCERRCGCICGNAHTWGSPVAADDIPEDLRDPFYIDQYEQEHIKPPVIKLLLSSELYCRVCSLILKGDQVASLQGHQSVIQALSRKGIYVMESDDTPVTEPDLSHAPIKMVSGLDGGGQPGGGCCAPAAQRSCPESLGLRPPSLGGMWLGWNGVRAASPSVSPGQHCPTPAAVNRVAFRGGDMELPSPL